MSEKDLFDDLESLKIQLTEAELEVQQEIKKRAQEGYAKKLKLWGNNEPYAVVPLRLVPTLAKELSSAHWGVLLNLYYNQIVLNKGNPIRATAKTTGCAKHDTRREAIKRLENLGLARVDWGTSKTAPVITLTANIKLSKRRD